MEDLLQQLLAEILQRMGVTFNKFKVTVDTETAQGKAPLYRIDIDTDESGLLIGHHGENIYALQHVLKTVAWKKTGENIFVVIDIDGYRKRQEENVVQLAIRKAQGVQTGGGSQALPPMSPYFRRIVHLALAKPEFSDLTTESIGEGDNRAVVIKSK
ncbi:KH domain-containing protein [Candidatus Gracilibacteria bacterium]|nr:KH domain-containing protein [Candidatus Gracilibacteria bacterium]